MGIGMLRAVRGGVLTTLAVVVWLLRIAAETPWWTVDLDLALIDLRLPDIYLGGLRGDVFLWSAAAACGSYGLAALPVPDRVRRSVAILGLTASVVAAVALVVLSLRVLRHDADAHRAWTPRIWERYLAERAESDGLGTYLGLAATSTPGLSLAMAATGTLLILGPLLVLGRRYERTAFLGVTMVLIVAALLLPSSTVWVTTGPQAVDRAWTWLPTYLDDAWPAVAIMLALVAVLGAGLLVRPGGRVSRRWGVVWAWTLFMLWSVGSIAAGYLADPGYSPLLDHEPFDYSTPPADRGVVLNGLFVLVFVLPGVVAARVGIADALAAQTTPPVAERRPAPA